MASVDDPGSRLEPSFPPHGPSLHADEQELPCTSNMRDMGGQIKKKLRVLCLHGFRTSGAILKHQLFKRWDNALLHDLLDLAFLDAPLPCIGKSDVEGVFPPPFYEWFRYNIIFTEYTGLEECLLYISNFMYKNGPFDGLLGFSQGAVLCAALAGLQQKGLALPGHPPLRFVLIISGAMFKNVKVKEECYSELIRCPSVHFIGTKDWLKPKNEELRERFENPVVIRHGAKHTVPRLDEDAIAILGTFLNGMLRHDIDNNEAEFEITEESIRHHEECLPEIEVQA